MEGKEERRRQRVGVREWVTWWVWMNPTGILFWFWCSRPIQTGRDMYVLTPGATCTCFSLWSTTLNLFMWNTSWFAETLVRGGMHYGKCSSFVLFACKRVVKVEFQYKVDNFTSTSPHASLGSGSLTLTALVPFFSTSSAYVTCCTRK